MNESPALAATFASNPRPWIVSANVPWISSHARTHREQTMHFDGSKVKYGLLVSGSRSRWSWPSVPYRTVRNPTSPATSCSSQSPFAGHVRQSSGWSEMYSSITFRRRRSSRGVWVRTCIPSTTGVVHDAGAPGRPSISTRQSRHEPKASRRSVAQSFGIAEPASAAARITDVPTGTATARPSISSETTPAPATGFVPRSTSELKVMCSPAPVRVVAVRR